MVQDVGNFNSIRNYCRTAFGGSLRCEVTSKKGRIFVACRHLERGSQLLVDSPLVLVSGATDAPAYARLRNLALEHNFAYTPLLYWCVLCSLTKEDLFLCDESIPRASSEQQERLLLLCQRDADDEICADLEILMEEFLPFIPDKHAMASKLDRLLVVWLHNCFEHSEDPQGYSMFFMKSVLSHSCHPNCMWQYTGDRFVLRVRVGVEEGDEVTVSYISEETLLEPTAVRRTLLKTSKRFMCRCDRCMAPVDGVRAFNCPACKDGDIFLDTTNATPRPSIYGACKRCEFVPDGSQVELMHTQEEQLEQLVEEWDRKASRAPPELYLSTPVAVRIENDIAGLLSTQHWLRDRVCRHLVSYYDATDRVDLALPLAKQNAEFISRTYPGYSALHAWALENIGDLSLRLEGLRLSGATDEEAPSTVNASQQLVRAWREASTVYAEAAQILGILFGKDHDFHVALCDKYNYLAQLVGCDDRGMPVD